jgi:NADH-quinone oxidoreductase subunit J
LIGGLIWYLFAVTAVAAALLVATSRSVIHCGFGLLFTLLGVCAMYAFLGADFLAVTQVIVYVGGILVLILFGVMMTHRMQSSRLKDELVQPFAAAGAAVLVFAVSAILIYRQAWNVVEPAESVPTTSGLGKAFLTTFLFPFEFASILLLVAMMGAALITRDRKKSEGE